MAAFVQSSVVAKQTAQHTAITIAVPAGGTTAGNTLMVALVVHPKDNLSFAISDTKGNSYQQATTGAVNGTLTVKCWYCVNARALTSTDTITISYAATRAA